MSAATAPAALPERQPDAADVEAIIALYTEGRLEEAEAKALKLIKKFPRAHALFNILGAVQTKLARTEDAIASYVKAITIKPDFAEAHFNLGSTRAKSGLTAQAIESYRRAVRIDPDHAPAHNNLGLALIDLGRFEEDYATGVGEYLAGRLNIDDLLKRRELLFEQTEQIAFLNFIVGANVAELCTATGKFFKLLNGPQQPG